MEKEGTIKFLLDFSQSSPPNLCGLGELNAWRQILFRLGLTGQNPARYSGLAFGNVSLRTALGCFAVSGTQTGGKPQLGAEDYCLVLDFDLEQNRIRAAGPIAPSSEALTHGAVYAANSAVSCVLHVHSPEIWRYAGQLGLHVTDTGISYGTPEMAQATGHRQRSHSRFGKCHRNGRA